MSVQQEHLKGEGGASLGGERAARTEAPPQLAYTARDTDESLAAYGAAIGGAIIGTLLTLLVLAIINGGTLRFVDSSRLEALEASVARLDENVGTLDQNVQVLAEQVEVLGPVQGQVEELAGNLGALQGNLESVQTILDEQGIQLAELDQAVATLDQTRRNFDTFTLKLAEALSEIGVVPAPENVPAIPSEKPVAPAEETEEVPGEAAMPAEEAPTGEVTEEAPAASEAAAAEAEADAPAEMEAALPVPVVVASPEVPPHAIQVYTFVDANGDGLRDMDEANLIGISVALVSADGEVISELTTDQGILFEALEPGEYTVQVEDSLGYNLAVVDRVTVQVAEDEVEGQVIYFVIAGSSEAP